MSTSQGMTCNQPRCHWTSFYLDILDMQCLPICLPWLAGDLNLDLRSHLSIIELNSVGRYAKLAKGTNYTRPSPTKHAKPTGVHISYIYVNKIIFIYKSIYACNFKYLDLEYEYIYIHIIIYIYFFFWICKYRDICLKYPCIIWNNPCSFFASCLYHLVKARRQTWNPPHL